MEKHEERMISICFPGNFYIPEALPKSPKSAKSRLYDNSGNVILTLFSCYFHIENTMEK